MNYIKLLGKLADLEAKEAKSEQDIIDLKSDIEKLKMEKP